MSDTRTPRQQRRLIVAAFAFTIASTFAQASSLAAEPVRFIDGVPVVSVELGAIHADFILDTGAQTGITVPPPLITPVTGVSLASGTQEMRDASGKHVSVRKLIVDNVAIGGTAFGPVDGLVNYEWGLAVGGDAPAVTQKGVIGLGTLDKKNVLLDFRNSRISFDELGSIPSDVLGWSKIPFVLDKRGIVLDLAINGKAAVFALDSAATGSVLKVTSSIFEKGGLPCSKAKAASGYCGIYTARKASSNGVDLGQLPFAVVQMGDVPFDGLLGVDFLANHKIFLDFAAKTAFVQ